MIYTCTLNPSVDYILHVEEFQAGGLNRGENPFYYPGGKGINVSRVLSRLKIENTALGFLGGFTGAFLQQALESENVQHDFIKVDTTTRINLKLKSKAETEINGPGPDITQEQIDALFTQFDQFKEGDYFVASGSVPKQMEDSFYKKAAEICAKKGVKMIADTSSKALKSISESDLFLIKPNHHELGELFNTEIRSVEDAVHYGKILNKQGSKHVIISMGGEGAVYINKETCLRAKAPVRPVKNTVGAGDSTVAGFVAAISQNESPETAFRLAVASGSATAFQEDLCTLADVNELKDKIEITAID